MRLVLLLALILPLQSFASSWSCGAHDAGIAAAHQHCADHPGKANTAGGELRHHCGTCCSAAVALMPFRWTPPRLDSPEPSLPLKGSPPNIALDRLDRPPRPVSS